MRKTDKDMKVMDYRGTIVFLSAGTSPRFFAVMGGQHHWGGSWDTLKKKLDTVAVFEPFTALTIACNEIEEVQVIGVDMVDSQWIVEKDGHTHGGTRIGFHNELYTPDLRPRLVAYLATCAAWDRAEEQIKEARQSARADIEAKAIARPDK